MDPRLWSLLLCVMMVIAVMLEMLTPTMGGFTFVALGMGIASAYVGFHYSESFGWLMAAANLALFPISLYIGVVTLKRSPLMHRSAIQGNISNAPDSQSLKDLVGLEGRSITPLRPAGAALIGARRLDVVTEGKFVATDKPIKVIQVEGNRVIVEPL